MTENFVFYTGWLETIDGMAKELGEDYANKALYALVKYAATGEMVTSNALVKGWIIGSVMPSVDNAKERYDKAIANGSKGGAPQKVDRQQVIDLRNKGYTQKQIADELGCTERTIRNILRDCKAMEITPETVGNNYVEEPEITPETTGNKLLNVAVAEAVDNVVHVSVKNVVVDNEADNMYCNTIIVCLWRL